MSFDWCEYLTLAKELGGRSDEAASSEARLRSAVSRAYFAAYCSARNYLCDADGYQPPVTWEAQKQVIETLKGSAHSKQRVWIGEKLVRLKNRRNTADYDDKVPGIVNMSQYSLRVSGEVIALVDTLRKSSP